MSCKKTQNRIDRGIKEGRTFEEIGKEICSDDIKDPKRKVIRYVRKMPGYGEEWLLNDENASKHGYDNQELKRWLDKDSARKQAREKVKKIALATEGEKEGLTELVLGFKDVNEKGWDTTIKRCLSDIEIPKTALRFNKKYPERTKLLSRCLENIKFTQKLVEFHKDYPYTLKGTVNEIIKDIIGDSHDSEGKSEGGVE